MLRGKVVDVTPSRYMDDLPEDHVQQYERAEDEPMSKEEFSQQLRELLGKHREEPSPASGGRTERPAEAGK